MFITQEVIVCNKIVKGLNYSCWIGPINRYRRKYFPNADLDIILEYCMHLIYKNTMFKDYQALGYECLAKQYPGRHKS